VIHHKCQRTPLLLIIGWHNDTELQTWRILEAGEGHCFYAVRVQEGLLILVPSDVGIGLRLVEHHCHDLRSELSIVC